MKSSAGQKVAPRLSQYISLGGQLTSFTMLHTLSMSGWLPAFAFAFTPSARPSHRADSAHAVVRHSAALALRSERPAQGTLLHHELRSSAELAFAARLAEPARVLGTSAGWSARNFPVPLPIMTTPAGGAPEDHIAFSAAPPMISAYQFQCKKIN